MNLTEIFKNKKIYFIGIGGVGMSALALACQKLGAIVSGSDLCENSYILYLKKSGCKIFLTQEKKNINDFEMVIVSSAIKNNQCELVESRNQNIEIFKRSDLLKLFCDNIHSYAVAGAHGKTTTSSMLSHILIELEPKSSFIIGGILKSLNTNSFFCKNSTRLTFEADESDGSLAIYKPTSAIITNIELDHVDFYKSYDQLLIVYRQFVANIKNNFVCNYDDVSQYDFLSDAITFSTSNQIADYFGKILEYNESGLVFTLFCKGELLNKFNLSIYGEHNLNNLLGTIALLHIEQYKLSDVIEASRSYRGVKRRFELIFNKNDFYLFDDYAHHPTEINSIYKLLENHFCDYQKVAFFEPHRISRLEYFENEFIESLDQFDKVYYFDCYELDGNHNNSKNIFNKYDHFDFLNFSSLKETISKYENSKTVICTLNAGDLSGYINELYDKR